jgi:hypothetical protein
MESFYSTVATLSFTLLGLWFVVLQLRWQEWARDARSRRTAYSVFLALLSPGILSLGSQIAVEVRIFWRLVFIVGSLAGIVAAVFMLQSTARAGEQAPSARVIRGLTLVLYVFTLLTALAPEMYTVVGLTGLQGEALWVTLLVLLGVLMAWEAALEPPVTEK